MVLKFVNQATSQLSKHATVASCKGRFFYSVNQDFYLAS